jgi:hypothetical protein
MVDKERRKKLAYHMRQLSVGTASNDGFESDVMDDVTHDWLPEQYYRSTYAKTDDRVIVPILEVCWGLYDDTRHHYLTGSDQLSPKSLKIIAHCILFLHTELEYEWPFFETKSPIFSFSLTDFLVCILTLGQNFRKKRKAQLAAYEAFKKTGDSDYWPFYRKLDYDQQLFKQPFLSKQSAD